MTRLEEKTRILNMVQDGKLSAEDALQLLEALESSSSDQEDEKYELIPSYNGDRKARWLKILVTDQSGKKKVNLKVPLALVRWGLRMGGKVNFGNDSLKDLDLENVLTKEMLNDGVPGVLVDVEDDDNGERVLITLE